MSREKEKKMTEFQTATIKRQIQTFTEGIIKLGALQAFDDASSKIQIQMSDMYKEKRKALILLLKPKG